MDCIKIVPTSSRTLHAVATTYRHKRDLFLLLRKIRELYPYITKVINRNITWVSFHFAYFLQHHRKGYPQFALLLLVRHGLLLYADDFVVY